MGSPIHADLPTMFTHVGLFRLTPWPVSTSEPWEYLGIFKYPDNEAAFRVLGNSQVEIFETETFPAEDVETLWMSEQVL